MRRNCNLELRLLPSGYYNNGVVDSSGTDSDQSQRRTMEERTMEESTSTGISPKQNQPLTIFYGGKICVCDVTEFQARAILLLANRETDEKVKTPTAAAVAVAAAGGPEPSSPSVQSPVYSPTAALSMKRSLQRFLQKRKHRAQAMLPYHR